MPPHCATTQDHRILCRLNIPAQQLNEDTLHATWRRSFRAYTEEDQGAFDLYAFHGHWINLSAIPPKEAVAYTRIAIEYNIPQRNQQALRNAHYIRIEGVAHDAHLGN